MIAFKNILVPLDFDDATAHAIDVALGLAREYGAELTLMHAWFVPPMPYGGPFGLVLDQIRGDAQAALERAVDEAKTRHPACKGLLRGGDPWTSILDAARDTHADLIVLGSHGRRGVSRYVLGSVAENVIRRSPVPVIVIPPRLASTSADHTPVPASRIDSFSSSRAVGVAEHPPQK